MQVLGNHSCRDQTEGHRGERGLSDASVYTGLSESILFLSNLGEREATY